MRAANTDFAAYIGWTKKHSATAAMNEQIVGILCIMRSWVEFRFRRRLDV